MKLHELVVLIFLFNVTTFGNGPVMIPLLQANLVEERHAISVDQLLYAFTIARVTPGQANVYVASIGYMLFGFTGATLCTAAILAPGYLMLPLLHGYERLKDVRAVRRFTKGLTTTSVGLIFAAVLSIGRESLNTWVAWVVFALTLFLAYYLKWNPILSLAIASAAGLLLTFTPAAVG